MMIRKVMISAVTAVAILAATMTATTQKAEANPALILGIVAWKFVAIAATGIIVGALYVNARNRANAAPAGACPVHYRKNGTTYIRANCT